MLTSNLEERKKKNEKGTSIAFFLISLTHFWLIQFHTPEKKQNSKDYAFKRQPHQTVKHTQTIRRLLRKNCLSVFGHFVGLAFSGSQGNFHLLKNLMTYKSKNLIDE